MGEALLISGHSMLLRNIHCQKEVEKIREEGRVRKKTLSQSKGVKGMTRKEGKELKKREEGRKENLA